MLNKSNLKSEKLIFILGNGFDIDLGLKTSYKSFVKSRFWPCKNRLFPKDEVEKYDSEECLHDVLHEDTTSKSWYDLEAILGLYATSLCGYNPTQGVTSTLIERAEKDRIIYNKLTDSLASYLRKIQTGKLKNNSIASAVLRIILESSFDVKIFSFNYTNLNELATRLRIKDKFDVTYMHGNLTDGIIFGIESNMDFCPPYRYMCKEYSPVYKSRFLSNELHEAKHIVIFGHSLSAIDYHYFQRFFSEQSREYMTQSEKKNITIFTFDETSAWDIRDQLRNMNNKRLDLLYGQNEFNIIRTDGSDQEKFSQFCRTITDRDLYYR